MSPSANSNLLAASTPDAMVKIYGEFSFLPGSAIGAPLQGNIMPDGMWLQINGAVVQNNSSQTLELWNVFFSIDNSKGNLGAYSLIKGQSNYGIPIGLRLYFFNGTQAGLSFLFKTWPDKDIRWPGVTFTFDNVLLTIILRQKDKVKYQQ